MAPIQFVSVDKMTATCSPSGMTLPLPDVFLDCSQANLRTRTMPGMLARGCQAAQPQPNGRFRQKLPLTL